ncbi:FixH family protein [Labrys okinawensis]|uniref:FixH family protein n=1 Tax=Labrys okinawensis TaxID=346911 RepID=UPI0039BC8BC1
MLIFRSTRALGAAFVALSLSASVSSAFAGASDYEFQLLQPEAQVSNDAVVAVRLVDKRSGKPVPDAVVFASRIDMAPAGMAGMAAPIEAMPSTETGIYRFKARLAMAGGWRLSLAAKVQGEMETVQSQLTFKATP